MTLLSLLPTILFTVIVLAATFCETFRAAQQPTVPGARFVRLKSHLLPNRTTSSISKMSSEALISFDDVPSEAPAPAPAPALPSLGPSKFATKSTQAAKRLSLNLPPQSSNLRQHRHSATVISVSPVRSQILPPEAAVSNDPNEFLTALATQERRVLELRDELKKAESDLSKLKNQWAAHEATKKRNEIIYHAEPLRVMTSPKKPHFDSSRVEEEGVASQPNENRRASVGRPRPQRKVFSGGRHTRTLSLLSPNSVMVKDGGLQSPEDNATKPSSRERLPSPAAYMTTQNNTTAENAKGARDDIVNTGKQLVGDIREGLWTFIEDIRQATVGDEALSSTRTRQPAGTPKRPTLPPRKKSPAVAMAQNEEYITKTKNILDSLPESPSHGASGQPDVGVSLPRETPAEDEGWDNWDSPPPKTASSTGFSTTAASSPRTSVSSDASKEKRSSRSLEQLPWPVLTKLSPSNLTRTASALMSEWEKSLSSPEEEEKEGRRQDGVEGLSSVAIDAKSD